jgi:hypothetical protein
MTSDVQKRNPFENAEFADSFGLSEISRPVGLLPDRASLMILGAAAHQRIGDLSVNLEP